MEEGGVPFSTNLGTSSDSFMDLDYLDELLIEGCWLEAHGSEFSHFDSSIPISPVETSFPWPSLQAHNGESGGSTSKDGEEERKRLSFTENLSISPSQGPQHYRKSESHIESICKAVDYSAQSENFLLEGSELSRRWWIEPKASTSVMDRLIQALLHLKDCSKEKDALIQVWVPVTREGKRVLATNDQLLSLDLNCPRLARYREISMNYQFNVEEDSKEFDGLPGRVFKSKVPEWTPDVRFFTRDEYPRLGHAQKVDVRGTIGVPILEQGSHNCLGVIEVVLTTQKVQYRPELESVCKALEAVDLRSADVSGPQNVETCDSSYKAALPEITEVLKSACGSHGLPLAQTWVPCILQGKAGCRHSVENLRNCVSPVDSACYVGDSHIQGFHEACSDHHLLKGQGIVGRAFRTNQPCFSADVTACNKTEYPLSHHARMFGLKAAVAIHLRSICTGSVDFVLELFLPKNCVDPEEQKIMLTSLSTVIQNVSRTLRVVTDNELQEESALPDGVANSSVMNFSTAVPTVDQMQFLRPNSTQINHQESDGAVSLFQNEKSRGLLVESSEVKTGQPDSSSREDIRFITNVSVSGDGCSAHVNKTVEKRRMKAEKAITLQVLQQHFAGSLKDAARNLGVCPTTLKRICRQHGIQRWPSRKIKKVGHSLQKIKRVIDSVQGASGVLKLESFYSTFPELESRNALRTAQISNPKSTDNVEHIDGQQPENRILRPPPAASMSPSSSSSQTSSSSHWCSGGVPPSSYSLSGAGHEDPNVKEESGDAMLKRTRSDANLPLSSAGPKLFPRSQSHVSLRWLHKPEEDLIPAAEGSAQKSQEGDAPRIKVTCGEDKIRFRMKNNCRYKDLFQEICRRFGVDTPSGFLLKYLDDDAEWVLLTCDADLEECIDVCRSSQSNTIKLLLLPNSQMQCGRYFGIRGLPICRYSSTVPTTLNSKYEFELETELQVLPCHCR